MRRMMALGLVAMAAVVAAVPACAQGHGAPRGGARAAYAGGGHGFRAAMGGMRAHRARTGRSYGNGYGYGYGSGYGYLPYGGDTALQQGVAAEPAPMFAPLAPPAPPAPPAPARPEVKEYQWPVACETAAAKTTSTETASAEPEPFGLVLKDGSTVEAETVFAAEDGLHYVDLDGRHLRIAAGAVNRAATLKLNRERKLSLYLPAGE